MHYKEWQAKAVESTHRSVWIALESREQRLIVRTNKILAHTLSLGFLDSVVSWAIHTIVRVFWLISPAIPTNITFFVLYSFTFNKEEGVSQRSHPSYDPTSWAYPHNTATLQTLCFEAYRAPVPVKTTGCNWEENNYNGGNKEGSTTHTFADRYCVNEEGLTLNGSEGLSCFPVEPGGSTVQTRRWPRSKASNG